MKPFIMTCGMLRGQDDVLREGRVTQKMIDAVRAAHLPMVGNVTMLYTERDENNVQL